jgi:protein TonB
MASYSGTVDRRGRAAAIAAVLGVHGALAHVILSGFNVRMVSNVVDHLKTFDVVRPPPPPPPPPPPKPAPQQAKRDAGAPAKKADPTPVVAPQPRIPAPSPIPAAKIAGTGSASTSGAGASGNGTGAGGSGNGPGGGGSGGYTPAQKISKIPNQEYRRLVSTSGMDRGTVGVAIRVTPEGAATNCRVVRSSGSTAADSLMCQLTERYIRFRPARDPNGRPVAQDITWYPNWYRP